MNTRNSSFTYYKHAAAVNFTPLSTANYLYVLLARRGSAKALWFSYFLSAVCRLSFAVKAALLSAKQNSLRFLLTMSKSGRFSFRQKIPTFSERGQIYIVRSTFTEIWKLLNFGKANLLTENSVNYGMKIKFNGSFQDKNYFRMFLLSASSFGLDHSKLATFKQGWYFTLESCHLSIDD